MFIKIDKEKIKRIQISDWILGFIEGEGSFSTNRGFPRFSLFQNDFVPLVIIRDFFKVGSVTYKDNKHGWQYDVYGRNCWPIRVFCEDRIVSPRKKKQFESWKKLKWIKRVR